MKAVRFAALGAVLLLATGCGVRSTDVVEVGDPAYVRPTPTGPGSVTLYLTGPGGLLPVVRSGGQEEQSPGGAVLLLLSGPTDAEKDAGLGSELPNYYGGLVVGREGRSVNIRLERAVRDFPALARQQLACTAAHAVGEEASTTVTVTVTGTDGTLPPTACPF
ncbi:hypothetical protein AB0M57_00280 [Streptomyces sp. NPDC051597]|uniref:hypothetical protein n=1 Tax=Streptomyces sp. NPDC051597 TaxID=3155049 RepID=UPI003447ACBA